MRDSCEQTRCDFARSSRVWVQMLKSYLPNSSTWRRSGSQSASRLIFASNYCTPMNVSGALKSTIASNASSDQLAAVAPTSMTRKLGLARFIDKSSLSIVCRSPLPTSKLLNISIPRVEARRSAHHSFKTSKLHERRLDLSMKESKR